MQLTKFNPTWKMDIQYPPIAEKAANGITTYSPNSNFIEVAYPLTVDFSIKRAISSKLNTADFTITNLAPNTRANLVKDRYNQNDIGNGQERRQVIFSAGYQNQNQVCFAGNLMEAWSERRGTEILTHLSCQDGGYNAYNKFTNRTVAPNSGFSLTDILKTLAADLGLPIGHISNVDGNAPLRSMTLSGNSHSLIQDNFGQNQTFIDNEQFFFLGTNEYLDIPILLISSDTGLLATPRRQNTVIEVEMIFEPSVRIGQLVELKSTIDPRFNGQYKVIGLEHSGTISGAVNGSRITKLSLLIGAGLLGGLTPAT